MSFQFIGLNHVQIAAPEGSETEARSFFHNILGWPELPKPEPLRSRGGVWFQCGNHQVHIGIQRDFIPAVKAHPAFEVTNLDGLRSHLLLQRIPVIEDDARDGEGIRRFYLNDPFGNRLEFMERPGEQ
ncbi:glyoxalase [Cohnella sp. AR92]|uniref:glyoxalase n=1 Tax=Cohnella sp. AR92 TaxID=648716 RepID=UPI000F8C93E7|nr:glyoxalase [Cohnella sp. AR92]RUS47158.1 glyoxalase [Cohnella sp. AR92]